MFKREITIYQNFVREFIHESQSHSEIRWGPRITCGELLSHVRQTCRHGTQEYVFYYVFKRFWHIDIIESNV